MHCDAFFKGISQACNYYRFCSTHFSLFTSPSCTKYYIIYGNISYILLRHLGFIIKCKSNMTNSLLSSLFLDKSLLIKEMLIFILVTQSIKPNRPFITVLQPCYSNGHTDAIEDYSISILLYNSFSFILRQNLIGFLDFLYKGTTKIELSILVSSTVPSSV